MARKHQSGIRPYGAKESVKGCNNMANGRALVVLRHVSGDLSKYYLSCSSEVTVQYIFWEQTCIGNLLYASDKLENKLEFKP